MFNTYQGGTAGPFYFDFSTEDNELVVVVGQKSGDVKLEPEEYTVNLNDDQEQRPGGSVTLNKALPNSCFITIGYGDVKTPSFLESQEDFINALPQEPEKPKEPYYATIHLQGDIKADFDTSPGEKCISVIGLYSKKSGSSEYSNKAKQAEYANKSSYSDYANIAETATKATNATNAINAKKAEMADYSDNSFYAENAYKAIWANQTAFADETIHAKRADFAKTADVVNRTLNSDVSQTSRTSNFAFALAPGAKVPMAEQAGIAQQAYHAETATNAIYTEETDHAKTAEKACEAFTAVKADRARADCQGNVITEHYATKEELGNILVQFPDIAEKENLLKTASFVGGKVDGKGVVNGTNLELTVDSIAGLIVDSDGNLVPITDPNDWFQWITLTSQMHDPTVGYCLLNNDAITFPTATTSFVWLDNLPENIKASDIYCIYGDSPIVDEEKLVQWTSDFTESLDKHYIWNVYENGLESQTLPEHQTYRILWNNNLSRWEVLTAPADKRTQDKLKALEDNQNILSSIQHYVKFVDDINTAKLTSDKLFATMA